MNSHRTPLSQRAKQTLNDALQAIDLADFKVFPTPDVECPPEMLCANECTFNPIGLVTRFFGKAAMEGRDDLWGWGIIEADSDDEGGLDITGMFHVENREHPDTERLYPEDKAFWGDYDSATRHWSFRFGH